MYMFVDALKLELSTLPPSSRDPLIEVFVEDLRELSREALLLNLYISLRAGADLIVWMSSESPELVARFRLMLRSGYSGYVGEAYSFLAVYRPSQYFPPHHDLREYVVKASKDPYRYLVAYPMKKSPEWYLLPYEERRRIMAEHASLARALSAGKKIRSYTAYSYGIDDNEFLVIYEVEDLGQWSEIVEKLREAQHRRWVIREEPIIVGMYTPLDSLEKILSPGQGVKLSQL